MDFSGHSEHAPSDSAVAVAGASALPSASGGPKAMNPSSLTVEQLARLLTTGGAKMATAEIIRQHIELGAPVSADGRMNLVHYMAWVAREVANADGEN